MKLSIQVVITNPDERQDKWREALANYCAFADEVIVVNGGHPISYDDQKVKIVDMVWPEDWPWIELPKHLNFAKSHCTGDWILKMDIDQLIDISQKDELYKRMQMAPASTEALTLCKYSFMADMRYFVKGNNPILFRNLPHIGFGRNKEFPEGDMGMPMRMFEKPDKPSADGIPQGINLKKERTGFIYWNFDYTFKDEIVSRAHFYRNARAWQSHVGWPAWGADEESAFEFLLKQIEGNLKLATKRVKIADLPIDIRDAVVSLKPAQLGYNGWGTIQI